MTKMVDLTGQRFGLLTVAGRSPVKLSGEVAWICRCDCGQEKAVRGYSLRIGETKSCGCLRSKITGARRLVGMVGQRFGMLTVIGRSPTNLNGSAAWICRCDCGQEKAVRGVALRKGHTQSCGCSTGLIVSKTRRHDLVGRVFGRLTVIKWERHRYWWCRCQCGTETAVHVGNLKTGRTLSCGCLLREVATANGRRESFKDRPDRFRSDSEFASRPAKLYLAEVGGLFAKIGLSSDIKRRGGGQFTAIHYQREMPRACCWAVEKAALRETRANEPKEIPDWLYLHGGKTELREGLGITDTIALLDRLADRCEAIGWEAFLAET